MFADDEFLKPGVVQAPAMLALHGVDEFRRERFGVGIVLHDELGVPAEGGRPLEDGHGLQGHVLVGFYEVHLHDVMVLVHLRLEEGVKCCVVRLMAAQEEQRDGRVDGVLGGERQRSVFVWSVAISLAGVDVSRGERHAEHGVYLSSLTHGLWIVDIFIIKGIYDIL